MAEKLFTLNGLAEKLGRDRRTVTAALRGVTPDGRAGRYDGWSLATAWRHLDKVSRNSERSETKHADLIFDRLDAWPEIYGDDDKDEMLFDFDVAAPLMRLDSEQLLLCLRAGMPYAQRGHFGTGKGFTIRIAWAIEWMTMTAASLKREGSFQLLEKLGLAQ
ncbi:hypothetical protein ACSBOB_14715 [Mesorhizobium sp. ASY16-5R]|uniref:hypothetical protein n=1 Tax=Mesorhizobium sp. ASY16-5R TaxID=3445772 RepID=UPI003FA1734B